MSVKQWTVVGYLLLIAMSLGAILVLGIFVTATIFHSNEYLSTVMLTHYDQGLLMTEIFRRFAYFLTFLAFAVFVFEGNEYKRGRRDKISMISAFFIIATALMFSGVYTPEIMALQDQGMEATQSEAFESLHLGSEVDFKVLALSLAVLFIQRMRLMFVQKA